MIDDSHARISNSFVAASVRPDGDIGPFGDTQPFTLKPMPPVPNPSKDEGGRIGF